MPPGMPDCVQSIDRPAGMGEEILEGLGVGVGVVVGVGVRVGVGDGDGVGLGVGVAVGVGLPPVAGWKAMTPALGWVYPKPEVKVAATEPAEAWILSSVAIRSATTKRLVKPVPAE